MHSKIACDHNDHDHYADDVKDIHCFTPIEIPSVSNVLGRYSTIARDCDRGLSKSAHRGGDQARGMSSQFPCLALCRTLYSSPMRRERQVALGVAHLNGFAMICLSLRHGGYAPKLFPGYQRTFRSNEVSQRVARAIHLLRDQNK